MNRTRPLILLTVFLGAVSAGARTPSTALLVLNKEDASLAIVDPATRTVVGRVPTGEGPHEVAVSSDGTLAFVANYGARTPGSTLSVIDLVAQKELRRVDVKPLLRPHGLAVAGGMVFFTSEAEKTIGRYDPASHEIAPVFRTGQDGTHMVLVNRDATKIFAVNIGSNTITALERPAGAMTRAAIRWNETVIPVGRGPEGIDWSPDGREIWTAHSRDGGASVIDVATRTVTHTLDLQTRRSNRLKFTPDGRRVLVSDLDAGELVVLDAAARTPIKRLKLGKSPEGILMTPDGSRAYVAVNGDNAVAIIDLKTLEETGRISTGNGPDGMAWAVRRR
jgi:YVTN family beta-propeller protein